ncbi:MAG TPA: helix-turn-helix domain-containing protein [Acidimicrobiales bacterium]
MTRVGILAYDGCLATEVYGLSDVLLFANRVVDAQGVDAQPFRVSVVSPAGGTIRPASGPSLATSRARGVDQLVVPGFEAAPGRDLDRILGGLQREAAFVRRVASRGVPVASVCVGAFLLGQAGLLDGRAATTGWLFSSPLAKRYPRAMVRRDEVLVQDGPVTTAGAFSAVFDLALHLIRQRCGEDVARTAARIALVTDNRPSQAPHVDEALRTMRSEPFSEAVRQHLLERLSEPYDLTALARACAVSTRTLLRRFAAETGESPLAFLQRSRIEAAKRLLEAPGARVAEVMERVGYLDAAAFRKLFVRHTGMTPATYRRQFTPMATRIDPQTTSV